MESWEWAPEGELVLLVGRLRWCVWSMSCAACRADLVAQSLLLNTCRPSLTLSGVDILYRERMGAGG